VRTQVDFEGGAQVSKPKDYSDKLMAPSTTPSTTEEESIRRATGGAKPTINTDVKTTKLPGL
jgi:hypothetical protein